MKIFLLIATLISLLTIQAQYFTPGTGVIWNMDSLALNSTAVELISANNYRILQDITISANDSVYVLNNNLRFSNGVRITVSDGSLYINGGANYGDLVSYISGESYNGFRLEGSSIVEFNNVILKNCGGIKVLSPNFKIQNSLAENNPTGINSSGFIELSSGKPEIINNSFINSEVSAVSSAANATVAPIIRGNIFAVNVSSNTNRPQINLSPSGASDTTYIEDNTITGSLNNEMAGGIAFSALAGGIGNVVIRNNIIESNRYGITILGNNLTALIVNNEIRNNNTQNLPNLGGSGINLNGNATSTAVLSNNIITNNLWGVTVLGTFDVNLGDSHIGGNNIGENTFSENENGGETYALFNNTPNQINATNNCWEINEESTLQNAENVISHKVDDNSLGEVIFDPLLSCNVVGIEKEFNELIHIYPNPAKEAIKISSNSREIEIISLQLFTMSGQNIISSYDKNKLEINLRSIPSGVYFLKIQTENSEITKKVIVL